MKLKEKLSFNGFECKRFQIRFPFGDTGEEQTKRFMLDGFDIWVIRLLISPSRSDLYARSSQQEFPLQSLTKIAA